MLPRPVGRTVGAASATLLVVAASVLFLSASPASSIPPASAAPPAVAQAECRVDDDLPDGNPAIVEDKIAIARMDARCALNRPACNGLLSGRVFPGSAREV